MSSPIPRLLRIKEVAQITGLERWRLYQMIQEGTAPPVIRIGRTFRISESALVKWIEEQQRTSVEE
jgi:excisionase family DNA binding protein